MSATTDSVTRPLSPVVYVQSLSLDDKQAVLVALLREAIQINGDDAPMPIEDESGQSMGYYLPPTPTKLQVENVGPRLTTEEQTKIEQRLHHLDDAIPIREVIADFKQRLAALQMQPQ